MGVTLDYLTKKEKINIYPKENNDNAYILNRLNKEGKPEQIKINVGVDKFLSEAKLYTPKNGEPILIGVCTFNEMKKVKTSKVTDFAGYFIVKLQDIKNNTLGDISLKEFDEAFLADPPTFATGEYIIINKIMESDKDDYTVLFKRCWYNMNPAGSGGIIRPIYNALNVTNIDSKGVNWTKTITKEGDVKLYASDAIITEAKDGYYIFLNGDKGADASGRWGKSAVCRVDMDNKGEITVNTCVVEGKVDGVLAKPCFDDDGNVYIPLQTKKEFKLIKFSVK